MATSQELQILKGKLILIVDDSIDNQIIATQILKDAGAEIEIASNGADAVKMALSGNHHAILMDLNMPGMDGLSATAQLRKKGYRKPIIVATADRQESVMLRAFESGCNEFLSKPLVFSSLLLAIRNLLNFPNFGLT